MDTQIEYLETMYLEETKEPVSGCFKQGNIVRGFDNYVNVRLNPRGSLYQKRSRLEPRERLFSLSSTASPANTLLDQATEVKIESGMNGNASHM